MQTKFLLVVLTLFCGLLQPAFGQGNAFTYQGQLTAGGAAVSGSYDFAFSIFSADSSGSVLSGPVTNFNVTVTNGLFTALLTNFPAAVFNGSNLWLDISVRPSGNGLFSELTPRQQLTPSPYAIFAGSTSNFTGTVNNAQLAHNSVSVVAGAGLSGGGTVALGGSTTLTNTGVLAVVGNSDIIATTVNGAVSLGTTATSANTASAIVKRDATGGFSAQNIAAATFSGNGANLTGVNAASLSGLAASNLWQTGGNTGANPTNGYFIGNADNFPLELRVNNGRALRLEPTASGGPNVIGGYAGNFVSPGAYSATVAGGGGPGSTNAVTFLGGTVSGGFNNTASNYNTVVAGGANNFAGGNAAVIGGGSENTAAGDHATVLGGQANTIQGGGTHGAILGGFANTNSGSFAVIAGGYSNTATASYTFAAGLQAQATNQGSFVWADSQGTPFGSTTTNQFNVRAAGGLRFVTGGAGVTVDGQTVLAGNISPSQITDNGTGAFSSFQNAAQNLGGDSALVFSNLFPMPATNGVTPSFSFTVGGAAFGTVIGFSGSEGISKPYNYTVEVSYTGAEVSPAGEVGQQGALTFTRNGRSTMFAGAVTGCTVSGANGTGLLYTFRLESPLAYLALGSDYKMFQSVSVPDVAAKVYLDSGSSIGSSNLVNSYPQHSTLTQFGETGFNFFSRILENEGIFYFFNQSGSAPSLVLGDNTLAYLAAPNSPFTYYGNTASNIPAGAEYVRTFQNGVRQATLGTIVNSYDFRNPNSNLAATNSGLGGTDTNYEFGNAVATSAYDALLAARHEAAQTALRTSINGSGNVPDLRAGYSFTLNDQSSGGQGGSYVVTAVHHAGFVLVTNGVTTVFYGNSFQAIPTSFAFAPSLVTPKPQAQPCSAVVTVLAGQTVTTDAYGRVKVQFLWDRYGKTNDQSSGWIRLSSAIASGSGRGMVFLPQAGDEVVVSFLQGDPDQPVITGSVYNANNLPPYSLPANNYVSTIRTTGWLGDSNLANEVRFIDKTGAEQLGLFAARDMALTAANNLTVSAAQTTLGGPVSVSGALSASTLSVNGGTVFTNYQAGQVIAGSSTSNMTTVFITFPKMFNTVPKIIATTSSDPAWNNVNDTFVASVRNISTTGCTVNIIRIDSTAAWSQSLRLNWIAWE